MAYSCPRRCRDKSACCSASCLRIKVKIKNTQIGYHQPYYGYESTSPGQRHQLGQRTFSPGAPACAGRAVRHPIPQLLRKRGDCPGPVGHRRSAARAGSFVGRRFAYRAQAGQPEALPGQRQRASVCRAAWPGAQDHGLGGCAAHCARPVGGADRCRFYLRLGGPAAGHGAE